MPSSSHEVIPGVVAEALALTRPQVGCQVVHRFGPGVYIRECHIPAGAFVVSKRHRHGHTNIMLAGEVAMSENDGPVHMVKAPHFYVSEPGQKQGLFYVDTVWQNIYATEERDIDVLEGMLFEVSPVFEVCANEVSRIQRLEREADRADFLAVLEMCEMTPERARELSETDDVIPMPPGWNVTIRNSAIEGRGVFLQGVGARKGDVIGPARIAKMRTPAGRFTNHSRNPNAEFKINWDSNNLAEILLVALRDIQPYCNELVPGDEVTVDYRQALSVNMRF